MGFRADSCVRRYFGLLGRERPGPRSLSLSLSLDLHFDRVQATSVPSLRPMRFREEKESPEVALFQATCLWDIFDSTSVAMRLIWTNKLPCWVYLGLLESITVESSSMATLP